MPDLPNRPQHEYDAARRLTVALESQRRRLATIGPEAADKRTDEQWKNDEDELAAMLLLMMLRPWTEAGDTLVSEFTVPIAAHERATDYRRWAMDASRQRAAKIIDGNRAIVTAAVIELRQAAAASTAEPGTLPPGVTSTDLGEARNLSAISTIPRIERNAVTIVTEAASAGEEAVATRFNRWGRGTLTAIWRIEDANACPICKKLNGTPITTQFPPAHDHCRCFPEWRLVP